MQRHTPSTPSNDTRNGKISLHDLFLDDPGNENPDVWEFTQHIFEKSNAGFFEWFAPSDTFRYSRSFERMLGYARDELTLNEPTIAAHIYKEDFLGLQKLFSRSALLGEDFDTQVRMYTREGKLRWYQVHVTVFSKTSSGCTKSAIGSVTDIDDIKVAQEESLRRADNEHWLASTIRSLFSNDTSDAIERCLAELCSRFAIDVCILRDVRDNAESFHLINVNYHPNFNQRFAIAECLHADELPFDLGLLLAGHSHVVDYVNQSQDQYVAQNTKLFEGATAFAAIPIFYHGELDYFLSLVRVGQSQSWHEQIFRTIEIVGDALAMVAARQQMSQTLANSELRFQHAFDATQDGIWDWDLEQQNFFVTPTFLYMLGHDEELLPLTEEKINQFLYEPTTVRDFFTVIQANPKSTQGGFELELPMRHRGGNTIWVLVRAKYTAWNSAGEPTRCVGVNKEFTYYKTAQRKLIVDQRRARQALQHIQNQREDALGITTKIKQALAQSIALRQKIDDANLLSGITSCLHHQEKLLSQLETLLQMRREDSLPTIQVTSECFDLHEMLDELAHNCLSTAQKNAVPFHLDIADNVPQWVMGPRSDIEDTLSTVLSTVLTGLNNASLMFCVGTLKATEKDTLVRFSLNSEQMLDNAELLDVCFDKVTHLGGEFYQSENSHYNLHVFFTLEFSNATMDDTDGTQQSDDALLARASVLLAEDNPVNQQVAMGILKRKGVTVTVANNGQEAVETLLTSKPNDFDLVLMDMEMPVLDGYQAARKIRQTDAISHIPIIALTAHAMKEDRHNCLSAGMNDYVPKPVKPELLYAAIIKQLRRRAHAS